MIKIKTGVNTSTIIHTGKREKVKCNCRICMNFAKNVCKLGRDLYPHKCKWYANRNDYNSLDKQERQKIKERNSLDKKERKEKANYNNGFGDMQVHTVDLSKYKKY